MEKRPDGTPGPHTLLEKLHVVYDNTGTSNIPPVRRVNELDFWPNQPMRTANLPSEMVFLRLVNAVDVIQHAEETKTRRKNRLSYAVSLARQLHDTFYENEEGTRFYQEQMALLQENVPTLAEDISKIMQKASDSKRFRRR